MLFEQRRDELVPFRLASQHTTTHGHTHTHTNNPSPLGGKGFLLVVPLTDSKGEVLRCSTARESAPRGTSFHPAGPRRWPAGPGGPAGGAARAAAGAAAGGAGN